MISANYSITISDYKKPDVIVTTKEFISKKSLIVQPQGSENYNGIPDNVIVNGTLASFCTYIFNAGTGAAVAVPYNWIFEGT